MDRDLETICLKCLARQPEQRYSSAQALAEDLARWLAGEPIEARPSTSWERAVKWARRRPALAALAAVSVTAAAALLVMGLWYNAQLQMALTKVVNVQHSADEQELAARQSSADAEHEREAAKRAAIQARDSLTHAESLRLAAEAAVVRPANPGQALLLSLEAVRRGRPRLAAHNNALLAALNDCREQRTLFGPKIGALNEGYLAHGGNSVCFSPDGGRLATNTFHLVDIGPSNPRAFEGNATQVWEVATGKLLATLTVPGLLPATACFSPDGRLLVITYELGSIVHFADKTQCLYTDRSARLWDVDTGNELHVLKGHTDRVVSASFSPDGKRILTASWDQTARLWDTATGRELAVLKRGDLSLAKAVFSADGKRLLTVSNLSDNRSMTGLAQYPIPATVDPPIRGDVLCQRIFPILGRSSSGGQLGTTDSAPARLWDADSGQEIAALTDKDPQAGHTTCASFSSDGNRILTGSIQGAATLWDSRTGKRLFRFYVSGQLISARFSPDGQFLDFIDQDYHFTRASVSPKDHALAWLGKWQMHLPGKLTAIPSPNGHHILVFTTNHERKPGPNVRPANLNHPLFDVPEPATASLREMATGREVLLLKGHEDDILSAAFSPDGRQVATGSRDGTTRLWDALPGERAVTLLQGSAGTVGTIQFSTDGQYVLTANGQASSSGCGTGDLAARLWDAASGRRIFTLMGHEKLAEFPWRNETMGNIHTARFSPDGRLVLTIAEDPKTRILEKGTEKVIPFTPVRIWDVATGKELTGLKSSLCGVREAWFSPDSRRVLTVSDGEERIRVFSPDQPLRNANQTRSLLGQDDSVCIWEVATGKLLRAILPKETESICHSAAWSPDGRRVFTAAHVQGSSPEPTYQARVWDADTGKALVTLEEGPGAVYGAEFSPDGRYLLGFLVSFLDGREFATLWDAATGKRLAFALGPGAPAAPVDGGGNQALPDRQF